MVLKGYHIYQFSQTFFPLLQFDECNEVLEHFHFLLTSSSSAGVRGVLCNILFLSTMMIFDFSHDILAMDWIFRIFVVIG
jgi:hypothetical protein